MFDQIARVFVCLFIGELLSRCGVLPVPGSVIGLMLLFLDLWRIGEVPVALGNIADNLLALLGIMFVPGGVGVLAYQDLLRAELLPILAAIVVGTLVALATTMVSAALVAQAPARRHLGVAREVCDATL